MRVQYVNKDGAYKTLGSTTEAYNFYGHYSETMSHCLLGMSIFLFDSEVKIIKVKIADLKLALR